MNKLIKEIIGRRNISKYKRYLEEINHNDIITINIAMSTMCNVGIPKNDEEYNALQYALQKFNKTCNEYIDIASNNLKSYENIIKQLKEE